MSIREAPYTTLKPTLIKEPYKTDPFMVACSYIRHSFLEQLLQHDELATEATGINHSRDLNHDRMP